MAPQQVTIVGGGMITHDQLLPALYHLQRLGVVGPIAICSLWSGPLQCLNESTVLRRAFPGSTFTPHPDLSEDDTKMFPDLYKEVLRAMPPRQIVVIAVPDQFHYDVLKEALAADQHVLCVKPLVLKYEDSVEIERLAFEKGLFVGVEYHKRFDPRALLAKGDYAAGRFGEFRVGEARMIEPWYYRHSNFQNWFVKENSDPFTYVGCHYVDQLYFITGLRPVSVSVLGIEGTFPNGNIGYMWSSGRVVFENGGILSVIDGLGYPDDAPGSNDQGLTLFCDDGRRGALIRHNDQFRGVKHCYVKDPGPGGTLANYVNPDYMKLVPWQGEGLRPTGYGYESVAAIVGTIQRIAEATAGMTETAALPERRRIVREVDAKGIVATPSNSYINELVMEAGRMSILNGGQTVEIVYGAHPHVKA